MLTSIALPWFWIAQRSFKGGSGAAASYLFQRLGATFIKIGQIISTRPDIFSAEFTAALVTLQDRVTPFRFSAVRRAIEEDFGRKLEEIFIRFDEEPVASASVSQVHRAVLRAEELPPTFQSPEVAVKVRRPGIVRRAYLDEAILEFGARLLSLIPSFSLISPLEAVRQFCDAVNLQLDFRIEAENSHQFRKNFENDPDILFPALVDQLCSDRILTMQFIDGVKADQIRAVGNDPVLIARRGTEMIVRMIFQHGFVHADLHPGNLLYLPGNRTAVLDLGLVGRLDEENRRRFAFLCYYLAAGLGREVARWLLEQSRQKTVRDGAGYERAIIEAVAAFHDRPFEEVQLTGLIATLYDIARRHRIRYEATYTVPNIALMVIEGIGRRIDPKLNISREARPHLESALALAVAGRRADEATDVETPAALPTSFAAGRYRLRRLLGEGIRKRVYLARDTRLDRDIALALIRTEGLDDAGRARVLAEARAVARLGDHPRIVAVYDSGEEGGVPYIISQYMAGGTLSGRLLRTSEHRMPLEQALRFAGEICEALEHAHAKGIIHRDVKPENVWLSEDGIAKLGDFGLARRLGQHDGGFEGMTVGTALYMSPEQALGRSVDARSDLYSFGATLYELLTGRPPFEGDSVAEVVARHINSNPESPSRRNPLISPVLDALVLKLLAKAPENRFESATAVKAALREIADTPSAGVTPARANDDTHADRVAPTATLFVGREQEMGRLRKGLEEALAGRGKLLLLVGEPGIGKTRTAEQLASYASRRGARVLLGRCYEGDAAPAFWPWVQILRSFLEGRDGARLESDLGSGGPYVAQIVPEVRDMCPDIEPLTAAEGEQARFRLFDAITAFLKRASVSEPLFLLLDDLHWADKPSLLLLQFLVRELAGARILIVGTYRDVDVQHGHPLSEVLPSLRRERSYERILLRGLPEHEVHTLLATLAGVEVTDSFVRALHRETEGNPFFIEETVRHLVEEGMIESESGRWTSRLSPDQIGLPEGVVEVVGRRLARLSAECRGVLTIASALGREFDARPLERVAGLGKERLLDLLAEAVAARIVEEERRDYAGYRFSHALIRETLYGELGTTERVRLHRKIAEAFQDLYADDAEPHLSELAYHFLEAAPGGDMAAAIEYAAGAAERASRQLAYEEAASLYSRALKALDLMERPDEKQRCELLLSLGLAQWRAAEFEASQQTLVRAAEVAERHGTPEQLARAALSYGGEDIEITAGGVYRNVVRLLEKALAALDAGDSALRAMLMGRLAGTLVSSDRHQEMRKNAAEALAMARRLGDKHALASVLSTTLYATWEPDRLGDLEAVADEIIALGTELRDDRRKITGYIERGAVRYATGNLEASEADFAVVERMAAQLHEPYLRWFAGVNRAAAAIDAGRFDEAEELIAEGIAASGRGGENETAIRIFTAQRWILLWLKGDLHEGARLIVEFLRTMQGTVLPVFRAAESFFIAEIGDHAATREVVEDLGRNDFADIPRDLFWLLAAGTLGFSIATVGDAKAARPLYDLLLPYAHRNVGATFWQFCSCELVLGRLAATMSRFEEASGHFERALEAQRPRPPIMALTLVSYADLLLRQKRRDPQKVRALLGQALDISGRLGMKRITEQALALKLRAEGLDDASTHSSIDAVAASIEAKGVDLRRATAPNGTVTLLFSDMEAFTEMTERLGDVQAHRVMQAHHAIIRGALRGHGGAEIEEQGDGFLLAFPKATEALRYAITVQRELAAYRNEHPEEPIRVRMGLHTGEPIREGDRFFGKTVILTARIAAYAKGGEILASSLVHGLTESTGEFHFDGGEDVALKGLGGSHRIYAVAWDPNAPARCTRPPAAATGEPSADNLFLREGDFWTIRYEGNSFRMKDAKGVQYIAVLLRTPSVEVHATDLINGVTGGGGSSVMLSGAADVTIHADLGDAGEVLDAKARSDYRERLDSLRGELEEARSMNDPGRAERLEQEIDFLTQELSSAYGLGGRARRSSSTVERARKAVSSRVSDSISRIRKENPALAMHFAHSVHLGIFCRYAPEKDVRWSV